MLRSSLFLVLSMLFATTAAQCLQSTFYMDVFDISSGGFGFLGTVTRSNLNSNGGLTLTTSQDPSTWLKVELWDTCNGDPNFLKIVNPPNPAVGYISLVDGVSDCSLSNMGAVGKWAVVAPSDGYPHGAWPKAGSTLTTVHQGGSWSSTGTLCGECMTFRRTAFNELYPTWSNVGTGPFDMITLWDPTNGNLLAVPSAGDYQGSPLTVQVYVALTPV
ncbi:hypothetical protein DL96DRAFT_1628684 [Flagelloscypha sp. PMI_526]|nr:hypothetical protein DL96DRAFT_1628684 [Flagelloscypha sp. PMI_526]